MDSLYVVGVMIALVLTFLLALVPYAVASYRHHNCEWQIKTISMFGYIAGCFAGPNHVFWGLLIFGISWIVALIWALSDNVEEQETVSHIRSYTKWHTMTPVHIFDNAVLSYTTIRGYVQWTLDGVPSTIQEMREAKFCLTFDEWKRLSTEFSLCEDKEFGKVMKHNLDLIYQITFK